MECFQLALMDKDEENREMKKGMKKEIEELKTTKVEKKVVQVVLNQSMLLNNDVFDFEREAGIRVFFNIPPLDERKRNGIISEFLDKLGLLNGNFHGSGGNNKIFGLFRR